MDNAEFLRLVPWLQGVSWASVGGNGHESNRPIATLLFWLAPRYFALAELAQKHPEEFAALVGEKEQEACTHYNVQDWAKEKPGPETPIDVPSRARAFFRALTTERLEPSAANLNDVVTARLSPAGLQILDDYEQELGLPLRYRRHEVTDGNLWRGPLWSFMQQFGPKIGMHEGPVEANRITFEPKGPLDPTG